jgi:hypothetical protein
MILLIILHLIIGIVAHTIVENSTYHSDNYRHQSESYSIGNRVFSSGTLSFGFFIIFGAVYLLAAIIIFLIITKEANYISRLFNGCEKDVYDILDEADIRTWKLLKLNEPGKIKRISIYLNIFPLDRSKLLKNFLDKN